MRGDGIGVWDKAVGECTGQAYAGYIDIDLQPLVAWVTRKRTRREDEWAREVAADCSAILQLLDMPDADTPSRLTVRHILGQIVRIRNKTKAHGAVGPDFFQRANRHYINAVSQILRDSPIVRWEWFHLSVRAEKDNVRAIRLEGLNPHHVHMAEAEKLRPDIDGLHFRCHAKGHLFHSGGLLRTNRECSAFTFPNGAYTEKGVAEFLDYGTGRVEHVELPKYLQPPTPLPASATEGAATLDIYGNIFGNLPPRPDRYVRRERLEEELLTRMRDRNHPIITLHGRGGIGKTSLALHIAHLICDEPSSSYDHVLWISARDLELKPSGATDVRRAVADLKTICCTLGRLLDIEPSTDSLARLLQDPIALNANGILFIFDNFETLDNPREVHRFLDTHTHLPNKILITSRERAFKGDYPIEVGGMEYQEACQLLMQEASRLNIEGIMTEVDRNEIYEYTDGHPYVMRVLLGEIAKEKRRIPLKGFVPRRSDLLNVVFERSFNRLSEEGRWTFLCVSNWRSVVPELAIFVVLGLRGLDADKGIEECLRLSLLDRHDLLDGMPGYNAPELARLFGKKKLDGDPDRLLIREDLELLQLFGPLQLGRVVSVDAQTLVQRLTEELIAQGASSDASQTQRLDEIITSVAELYPSAWLDVVRFRKAIDADSDRIDEAFRRACEEVPYNKDVWVARAEFAKSQRNEVTEIASLVSAVDADPTDVQFIREAAGRLCQYVDSHKWEIPVARRGVYVASVRSHMERVAGQLDATGLSRLAWLFLLEENKNGAWKYATMGCEKDATNSHCLKILERLDEGGYRPLGD